jgi:Ca2+-binding RTX toxin-like protein
MQKQEMKILTESGNDTIDGGSGDDIIVSQEGNDKLIGGNGNDNLYGGLGSDTYVYNKGNGNDLIYDDYKQRVETNTYGTITVDYKAKDAGNDTLKFGSGITQQNLTFKQYYYDLLVYVKNESGDDSRIIIKDWFKEYNNIETFEFSVAQF